VEWKRQIPAKVIPDPPVRDGLDSGGAVAASAFCFF